jgi:hypothetical protein
MLSFLLMPVAMKWQGVYLMIMSPLKVKFGKSHLFLISRFNIVLNWNVVLFHNLSEAQDKLSFASVKSEKVGYFYLP